MATIGRVAFWNLKCGLKQFELENEILRIWPSVFRTAHEEGALKIVVFKPKNGKQKAVVSGFMTNLAEMTRMAIGQTIMGRNICFAADNGDERDKYGDFVHKRSRESIRGQVVLEGRSLRKITVILSSQIKQNLNSQIFNPLSKKATINSRNVPEDIMKIAGDVKFCGRHPTNHGFTLIRYQTALGLLQAMTLTNNNSTVVQPAFQFVSEDGRQICGLNIRKGIGSSEQINATKECILDLNCVVTHFGGYIPFQFLSKEILNQDIITSGFVSICWRCDTKKNNDGNSKYRLLGVGVDLDFLAGVCNCSYTRKNTGGYKWTGESFTRLVIGNQGLINENGQFVLSILHQPMISCYPDAETYSNVVLPIMEEEWFTTSSKFVEEYTTEGKVVAVVFIEQTEIALKSAKKMYGVFALDVLVPQTKSWRMENMVGIKKGAVDLMVVFYNSEQEASLLQNSKKQEMILQQKTRIRRIRTSGHHHLILEIQVYCTQNFVPVIAQPIKIYPKLDKLEYDCTRRFLHSWENGEVTNHPLLDFVLHPNVPNKWQLKSIGVNESKIYASFPIGIDAMESLMNHEQKIALNNAQDNSVSFIQGPPGTGKTFTAGCIVSILGTIEKGKIFVCAPSNEACDRCTEMITNLIKEFDLDLKVARMMARSKEIDVYGQDFILPSRNREIEYLHHLVRRSSDWLSSSSTVYEIHQKLQQLGIHRLTRTEWTQYEQHIKEIELGILLNTDIIVCTVATLADSRAEELAKLCDISTLLIDEAGQLAQPATLTVTLVNPKRVIIAGDHLQLQATVMSHSAKIAGLGKSELEWASGWVMRERSILKQFPPWTRLLEQYRMSPSIRKVVSRFAYNDELLDASSISTRTSLLPCSLLAVFPQIRNSSILIKDVDSKEIKMGTTYNNPTEAEEIVCLVNQLIENGVKPNQLTILSFYDAQRIEIIRRLKSQPCPQVQVVEVKNVDAYQGRENIIVLLSMVRSTTDVGFLKIPNRMTVAISRAKELFIVVCKSSTFRDCQNSAIKSFYTNLTENAQFI